MRKRVAVTGATGFVGGHLVAVLRRAGYPVRCLVRGAARAGDLRDAGCDVIAGDLADGAALAALVDGAEVVYHVAGAVAAADEAAFLRVNRDGTVRLLEAALEARVGRFLQVSSLAVSGPAVLRSPLEDTDAAAPVTPYGRSKLAGEEAVRRSGLPFTVLRPAAVYGPTDGQFLRLFRLARRGLVPLLGAGRQELSLVHVRDLAEAALAAAESPRCDQRTYHVAHPEIVTQRELVEAVGRALGRRVRPLGVPPPVVRAALAVSGAWGRLRGRPTLLSSDKAPELLAPAWTCRPFGLERDAGWTAAVSLREGLAETADWYRNAGWL